MIILINLYSNLAQWYIVASHVIVSLEGVGSTLAFVQIILYSDSVWCLWSPHGVHRLHTVCTGFARTHGGV